MTYIALMTRDCTQRTPAAGEAAADAGADGGDEAAAAGGGVNAGAQAAGAAMEADEGAEVEGGGAREARAPAKTTPRRESASAPAPHLTRGRRRPQRSGMANSDASPRSRDAPRPPRPPAVSRRRRGATPRAMSPPNQLHSQ